MKKLAIVFMTTMLCIGVIPQTFEARENGEYSFNEDIEFEKLTLEDFGFEGATTIGDKGQEESIIKEASPGSLHGVELEGIYNFSVGLDENVLLIGGKGCGLWIIPQTGGTIRFAHIDKAGAHRHPIDCGQYWTVTNGKIYNAGIRDLNLTGDDFKMNLKFIFSDPEKKTSDLKVIVTINDKYEDFMILEDVPVDSMERIIYARASLPMTLTTGEYEVEEPVETEEETELLEEEVPRYIDWNRIGVYMGIGAAGVIAVCIILLIVVSKLSGKEDVE